MVRLFLHQESPVGFLRANLLYTRLINPAPGLVACPQESPVASLVNTHHQGRVQHHQGCLAHIPVPALVMYLVESQRVVLQELLPCNQPENRPLSRQDVHQLSRLDSPLPSLR